MPSHRHHNNGNLYIKLTVKFPDTLSTEQMEALEKALPPRKPVGKINPKHHVEEVFLEEPTDRQRNGAEAMDEDDDEDMRGGGPGVQCAQRKWPSFPSVSPLLLIYKPLSSCRINNGFIRSLYHYPIGALFSPLYQLIACISRVLLPM